MARNENAGDSDSETELQYCRLWRFGVARGHVGWGQAVDDGIERDSKGPSSARPAGKHHLPVSSQLAAASRHSSSYLRECPEEGVAVSTELVPWRLFLSSFFTQQGELVLVFCDERREGGCVYQILTTVDVHLCKVQRQTAIIE